MTTKGVCTTLALVFLLITITTSVRSQQSNPEPDFLSTCQGCDPHDPLDTGAVEQIEIDLGNYLDNISHPGDEPLSGLVRLGTTQGGGNVGGWYFNYTPNSGGWPISISFGFPWGGQAGCGVLEVCNEWDQQ